MRAVVTLEAGAGEDRQARILGKARVGFAEFAEQELGAFAGGDELSVPACCAKTCVG